MGSRATPLKSVLTNRAILPIGWVAYSRVAVFRRERTCRAQKASETSRILLHMLRSEGGTFPRSSMVPQGGPLLRELLWSSRPDELPVTGKDDTRGGPRRQWRVAPSLSMMASISVRVSHTAPCDRPSSGSRATPWTAAPYAGRRQKVMRMKAQDVRWARDTRGLQRL